VSELLFPELLEDLGEPAFPEQDALDPECRVCGCREADACETPNGACFWLEVDLCSACTGEDG